MSDIQVKLKKKIILCNIGDLFDCVNQNIFGFVVFGVVNFFLIFKFQAFADYAAQVQNVNRVDIVCVCLGRGGGGKEGGRERVNGI